MTATQIDSMDSSRSLIWRRWFAFLGGGVAWTFHLLSIYVIGEFGCVSGFDRHVIAGISAVAWMLIGASVLCIVPALAAMIVGYLDSRKDDRRSESNPYDPGGRYLSSFGWPLSALFSVIIFVESLPVFGYLNGCS